MTMAHSFSKESG